MFRVLCIFIATMLCASCSTSSLYPSPPMKEGEPAFIFTKPHEGIVIFDFGLSFSELSYIADQIIAKYPEVVLDRDNFTISKIANITANNQEYTRIEFEYKYKQIDTLHGYPMQKFSVWKGEDSLMIFAKIQVWPL
jgi:hypothetical protein